MVSFPKIITRERLVPILDKVLRWKAQKSREAAQETRGECQDSLKYFVEHAWPHVDPSPFKSNWVIDGMCEHLEAVMLGQIQNLLINVPPRCSKTTVVSIMFPAWIWLRFHDIAPLSGPQVRFLTASYSDKLSLLSSNAFRRLVKSEWYSAMYPELKFTRDQDAKGHMDNNFKGSRQSTSVGGSLLGLGGDILIGDDLNNTDPENLIETGADRAKARVFWDEMRSTRRNNPNPGYSAVIGVQQRVNREDVSGHWMDNEDDLVKFIIPMRHDPLRHCVTVKLPQYDDDDPPWEDPRDPNGEDLMWPDYFGEFQVATYERALGPIMAAGRLQQSPVAKGGNIISRDWWCLWDAKQANLYGLRWDGEIREFPAMEMVVASLDTAQKEKEENDFNALTIWGIWIDRNRNRRAMLMYAWQGRKPLNGKEVFSMPNEPEAVYKRRKEQARGLVQEVAFWCNKYHVKRLLIEDKTRGHDVANEIRRQYAREQWGVQLLNPVQDKVSRAHTCVPLFTDDNIWAPNTRWAETVIEQCAGFPKDTHDDFVDSVTQFINWARANELLVMVEEASAFEAEQATYHGNQQTIADAYGV